MPPDVRLCISQRMMVFRVGLPHSPAYIMWQINCRHLYAQAAVDLVGAAAPHVNVSRILNLWFALPPLAEQELIALEIERTMRQPNAAILKAKRELNLIREFRTRLIADVVTGKLDVRAAAAKLPQKPEELAEPLDEIADVEADVEDHDGTDEEVEEVEA